MCVRCARHSIVTPSQLFLVVVNEYSLTFPSIVSVLSDYVSWLNLSLFSIVNLSCKVAFIDQFDRLKIVTLVPIALTAALGLMHALLRFDVLFEERKRRRWQHLLFTSVLVVMFLVLPSVWVADRPHLRHFASVIVQWCMCRPGCWLRPQRQRIGCVSVLGSSIACVTGVV